MISLSDLAIARTRAPKSSCTVILAMGVVLVVRSDVASSTCLECTMVNMKGPVDPILELRLKAEARFQERPARHWEAHKPPTVEEFHQTIYELQIHQIELDMQYDELCRSQAELESMRTDHPGPARSGQAMPAGPRVTNREKEILRLIVGGNTSRKIAEILGISPRTVETHRWRIMQKLSISNSVGLVKYAMAHGFGQG